jgi:hypothetical protein
MGYARLRGSRVSIVGITRNRANLPVPANLTSGGPTSNLTVRATGNCRPIIEVLLDRHRRSEPLVALTEELTHRCRPISKDRERTTDS